MLRRLAAEADVWRGEMVPVVVAGRRVVLINVDGTIVAFEDRCAHQGVAISEGRLSNGTVTCSAHHWQYDARTGAGKNPAGASLCSIPIRVVDGEILADLG